MEIQEQKRVDSKGFPLKTIFAEKFEVDFYQREYVWQRKQVEDLLNDLSNEFLKNWKKGDKTQEILYYDPYFMGEIILSEKTDGRNCIIDGQQRLTTLTLLLIYILKTYTAKIETINGLKGDIEKLIYSDYLGTQRFNLYIEERMECMWSLYNNGEYKIKENDSVSVKNIAERYIDIAECWNEKINESNILHFIYWIQEKIIFSKVWTNNDEFAYVIFETMNDRGLSLTQIEMLRSYLLVNISENNRNKSMEKFDETVKMLTSLKLSSTSKAEFEFFKMYFRAHLAEDLSQGKNSKSDFVQIGKEFYRWVSSNSKKLGLTSSIDYEEFILKIQFFANVYKKINELIVNRNTKDYLYLIVNNDYGFTLQPAPILASVNYNDSDEIIYEKIKIISKYLTKILSWRVWNHMMIAQSSLESTIYNLCKQIRNMNVEELQKFLDTNPIELEDLKEAPILNQQNKTKIKVLISLITEIVAKESGTSDYILNKKDIEIEHIWSNHFEEHIDECSNENEFAIMRNTIGDLLVLPKSFNASYNDDPYEEKIKHYIEQNILAQSLNESKYKNNPGFKEFITKSKLKFKSYIKFSRDSIIERSELYKKILLWNWKN